MTNCGEIGNEAAVNPLINALNDENLSVSISAAYALEKIANSSNLLKMWNMLLNGEYDTKNIIFRIQERYKFYNHDIFHCPSVEETSKTNPPNCPNNYIFNGEVGAVNTGTVNNQGNQIGIQYNQESE